jgi:hypothetical protein
MQSHTQRREQFIRRLAAVSAALGDPWVPQIAEFAEINLEAAVTAPSHAPQASLHERKGHVRPDRNRTSEQRRSIRAISSPHINGKPVVQLMSGAKRSAQSSSQPSNVRHAGTIAHQPTQYKQQGSTQEGRAFPSHHIPMVGSAHAMPQAATAGWQSASSETAPPTGSSPGNHDSCTPGWQRRMVHEAQRTHAVQSGAALAGPSSWTDIDAGPSLTSTRYISPPDITCKWGASRLPGVPSKLTLGPKRTPLEVLVAQRPFLRYADFLHNNLDRQPPVVPNAPEAQPVPRPAQLTVRRAR